MPVDVRAESVLPAPVAARIHALWDELADFGAHETDAALVHAMRVLSDLVGAQHAFWLGAVRLGTDHDALGGWRIRGIRRMDPRPEDEQVYKLARHSLDNGRSDAVTLAQVREAGVFRARLLRELAPPGFFATADYDVLYRAPHWAFVSARRRRSIFGRMEGRRRGMKTTLIAIGLLLLVGGAVFLSTFRAAPLSAPPPFVGDLPPASPPAGVALFQLPTGVTHRSAAFAYRGGAFSDHRDFSMAAALVRHPRGDVLIDTGFGRSIDAQFGLMPFPFRWMTSYTKLQPAVDQLDATGYDRRRLRGILLTHAHWDHVSGVADFPGVPVWITAAERRFIDDGGFVTAVARSLSGVSYENYDFDGGPYLGFPKSHDVYGDGAIVVVPAPGHTPGSVIVFVALPDGTRYAFVGDLVWQREGISQREERPWLQRRLADADAAAVRNNLLHMAAIAARFPALHIVPAHDARAFDELQRLPDATTRDAGAGAAGLTR